MIVRNRIQKDESVVIIWKDLLTPQDMRKTEQKAFEAGMPSILLMEHAAIKVVDALEKELGGCEGKDVVFLCGTGNNGGDGLAAARLFQMRGGRPEIWLSGDPKTPDAKTNLQMALACGIEVKNLAGLPREEWPFSEGYSPDKRRDGYVDALLGIGMKGEPDEITSAMILVPYHDFGNRVVIAVDVPSGMDALTGDCPGIYMHADVTVTFHAAKPGLYLSQDREAVGRIEVADIGLGAWHCTHLSDEEKEMDLEITTPEHLMYLSPRALDAHKGDFGRILIYAGSMGMAGAAAMCAKAAIAAGAGLTTVCCPKEIIPVLQTLVPSAMCMDIEEAVKNPPVYDVLAVGCGLSQKEGVWENILKLYDPEKPSVWDADALNLLAKHPMKLGKKAVITPHPGEAARLLDMTPDQVLEDPISSARMLQEKFGCCVLLKGDVSIACSISLITGLPMYVFNALGTPALAKGGSGDALAGILAALAHTEGVFASSAALASAWHGMAGIVGESKFGQRELTTMQLIDCLHEAEQWGKGKIPPPAAWKG